MTEKNWTHSRDPQDCAVLSLAFVLRWTHQKGSLSQPSYLELKTNFLRILVEQIEKNPQFWHFSICKQKQECKPSL